MTRLSSALANASAIARCTPARKVRAVQAFQKMGRTVAMTDDGAICQAIGIHRWQPA
jgi:cation-transporting P-type ATPase I